MFWHKIPVLVAKAGDVQASRHKYQIFFATNMDGNCPNPMVWRLQMLKQFASFLAGDSTTISSTTWSEVQVVIMSCECDMTHFFFFTWPEMFTNNILPWWHGRVWWGLGKDHVLVKLVKNVPTSHQKYPACKTALRLHCPHHLLTWKLTHQHVR